jgi:hypothetical protein
MAGPREASAEDLSQHLIASASTEAVEYLNFVLELAQWVDLWTRMRQVHTPTPDGFCSARICAKGGTGIALMPWPCVSRRLADLASRAHRRSADRGPGVLAAGGT